MTKRRRRRRRRQKPTLLGLLAALIVLAVGIGSRYLNQQPAPAAQSSQAVSQKAPAEKDAKAVYQALAKLNYQNGSDPVIAVNHGKSDLNPASWAGPKIVYGNLDRLNRTTVNVSYLNQQTLIRSAGRPSQSFQPTGWHNRYTWVDGKRVNRQNRGHLIAYTLSGNLNQDGRYQKGALGSSDNPKNLASQTEYANQVLMQRYEQQVRQVLEDGKRVVYQVTTVFRGDELMPRGYWLDAISTDRSLSFNVYLFNVQNGIRYDYATGRSQVDRQIMVKSAN